MKIFVTIIIYNTNNYKINNEILFSLLIIIIIILVQQCCYWSEHRIQRTGKTGLNEMDLKNEADAVEGG